MAKLIDIEKIKPMDFQSTEMDGLDVVRYLNTLPAVDAVEVVRCLDCKYSTLPSLVTQRYGVPGSLTCHNHNSPCNKRNVKGEGFCPYGDREEGAE